MKNTITLTDEQLQALQSGQSITIEPPKPIPEPFIIKWEPKGNGSYLITGDLRKVVATPSITYHHKESGLVYTDPDKAKQSAKALRSYARQLAWLDENDDGWKANWNDTTQGKFYISEIMNNSDKFSVCEAITYKDLNQIYMSKYNATKLCELLNSGIVEF